MGVPAFFRWLSRKYPSVIVDCTENKTTDEDGRTVLEDATLPNPNGVEFDNLYLDMNGIIHPCTHPEDKPAPKNEDEMMVAIYECIDRIMGIVRPRKVLYMAIDGVAPRAKMNQQRSRRFRAAKESVEKRAQIARIREELLSRGCILPPEKPKEEHFDSNCITPGTPFMERLSHCLHYYIHDRMNNNPAWKNIKVILSDANVPGEGEHKIMDYIRRQRAQPDHDPNTQHVLCGADADLIMLGLATHEPNFTIIREEFLPNKPKPCEMCNQFGHELDKCQGLNAVDVNSSLKPDIPVSAEVQFIFVRLSVLREYLKRTLAMPNLPFEYDFDRALDDWVFMCFFVGNDFLPHLPSLEIREGAVDRLVELYKKCVYKTGGYLTDSGEVNLERVQMILDDLGMVEDHIFKERQRKEEQFKARDKAKRRRMEFVRPDFRELHKSNFGPVPLGRNQGPSAIENPRQEIARLRMQQGERNASSSSDSKELESLIRPDNSNQRGTKRKASEMDGETNKEEEEEDYQNNDEVRLWEDGFKDRYYESKFDVGPDNLNFRDSVALQYVRGLCWVLKYYYQGCTSWKWYFPYHYAPFASDFVNISGLSTAFEKGTKPFNPLEQLMGVFPAASSSHVPKPWADLMSNPNSPIIDFYPEDFKIDLNGKKFAWQGVALLPFVEESRLFKALEPYYGKLTQAEITRNLCGDNRLYIASQNVGYKTLKALYKNEIDPDQEVAISIEGLQGSILLANENVGINKSLPSPIMGLNEIEENEVITVRFRDPKYSDDFIFPAKRLPKAVDPPTVLPTGGNEQGNHRPVISFNTNLPSANLGAAGHRMLNHYNRPNNDQGGNRNQYNNYGRGGGGGGNSNNYNNNGRGSGGGGANNYNNNGRGGGGGGGANNYNNNGRGGNWTQGNASRSYNSGGGGGRGEYQSNNYNQRGGRGGSYSNNNRFGNNNNYRQGNNNGNNGSEGGRGGGGGGYRRYNN